MIMTRRKYTEINGTDNFTTAEFWEYDSRLGRRWNVDSKPNIALSPYNCFAGNPIWFGDPFGDTLRGVNETSTMRIQEAMEIPQPEPPLDRVFQTQVNRNILQ